MEYATRMRSRAREIATVMVDVVHAQLNLVYTKRFFVISHPEGKTGIRFWVGILSDPVPIKHNHRIELGALFWSKDFQTEVDRQFISLIQGEGWQVESDEVPLPKPPIGMTARFVNWIRSGLGIPLQNMPAQAEINSIRFSLQEPAKGALVQFPKR